MDPATFNTILITVILIIIGGGVVTVLTIANLRSRIARQDGMLSVLRESKIELKNEAQSKIRKLLEQSQQQMQEKVERYEGELRTEKDSNRRLLAQKKSTEVRTGHILEKVAPLFQDFPGDIVDDNVIPVFKAFDYLVIKDDEIILVEVKSGNAGLSTRQKKLKKLVEAGKVSFQVFRRRGTEGEKDSEPEDQKSTGG